MAEARLQALEAAAAAKVAGGTRVTALATEADAAAALGGFFPMALQWTRYGAIAGAMGLPIAAR